MYYKKQVLNVSWCAIVSGRNLRERPKIFVDANVVIQAGKPQGGPILPRVKDSVDAGFISVLTTDLSCKEVAKRHAENDYKVIKNVGPSHFRQIVEELIGTELPEVFKGNYIR